MTYAPLSGRGARVAPLIDHTLLKAEAMPRQVEALCREALHYGFAAVCVNPSMVQRAAGALAGSAVKVCTVVGFPLGASTSTTKAFEAEDAVRLGARELDMVLAIGALKAGDRSAVLADIRAVVQAGGGCTVKVILETCLLTDEEKETACRLAMEAGAHFVKTSTGLAGGGATTEDIRRMRRVTGPAFGVKASGGIRTLDVALQLIEAGATRIGASASVAIVTG
jgi:deoxyribose-phosphate aldolase